MGIILILFISPLILASSFTLLMIRNLYINARTKKDSKLLKIENLNLIAAFSILIIAGGEYMFYQSAISVIEISSAHTLEEALLQKRAISCLETTCWGFPAIRIGIAINLITHDMENNKYHT